MQLNQPIPPPYSGDSQYDFILSGNQKAKKSLLPKGNSPKQRILYAVGGGILAVILIMVIFALVFGNSGGSTLALETIAQTQTELIRVSTAGATESRDVAVQGFAESIALTTTTGQQQTLSYLSAHKHKMDAKHLALGRNVKTDAALKSASEAGHYDEQLATELNQELTSYRDQLSKAYKEASSSTQKQLIQQLFNQVTVLLKNQPVVTSS